MMMMGCGIELPKLASQQMLYRRISGGDAVAAPVISPNIERPQSFQGTSVVSGKTPWENARRHSKWWVEVVGWSSCFKE
jgi:hypothetical protein